MQLAMGLSLLGILLRLASSVLRAGADFFAAATELVSGVVRLAEVLESARCSLWRRRC